MITTRPRLVCASLAARCVQTCDLVSAMTTRLFEVKVTAKVTIQKTNLFSYWYTCWQVAVRVSQAWCIKTKIQCLRTSKKEKPLRPRAAHSAQETLTPLRDLRCAWHHRKAIRMAKVFRCFLDKAKMVSTTKRIIVESAP